MSLINLLASHLGYYAFGKTRKVNFWKLLGRTSANECFTIRVYDLGSRVIAQTLLQCYCTSCILLWWSSGGFSDSPFYHMFSTQVSGISFGDWYCDYYCYSASFVVNVVWSVTFTVVTIGQRSETSDGSACDWCIVHLWFWRPPATLQWTVVLQSTCYDCTSQFVLISWLLIPTDKFSAYNAHCLNPPVPKEGGFLRIIFCLAPIPPIYFVYLFQSIKDIFWHITHYLTLDRSGF